MKETFAWKSKKNLRNDFLQLLFETSRIKFFALHCIFVFYCTVFLYLFAMITEIKILQTILV